MKTPPLLLFATLVFWGWQSHLLWFGVAAGALLEVSRLTEWRWDLEDVDFNRIWSFCVLLGVVLVAYIFTTNDEGGGFSGMLHGVTALRNATRSTVAATSVLRWLPLIFLPFAVAQFYNIRPTVPVTSVSLVLRIRRRRGEQSLAGRYLDISYGYFILCIFSAGIHNSNGTYFDTYSYFVGQAVLILWVLWTLRSPRYGATVWAAGLALVIALGCLGQFSITGLERVLQNFDAQMFSRFWHPRTDPLRSATAMGQIGELKLSPRIVVRLQPGKVGVISPYLHEASYRVYSSRSQMWFAGGHQQAQEDFSLAASSTNGTTTVLIPGITPKDSVSIACYLTGRSEGVPEGVVPLPPGTCRLENLPASTIVQTNETGAVLANGPGLMIFDARYAPRVALDSPPGTNRADLAVPTNEIPALEKVVTEMGLTNANVSEADKLLAVQTFFGRNFTYTTWQGADKRGTAEASPLTRFLLTSRNGHCEYFATATVLLLRELHIPARYSVGYAVHETSGSGYVVRERDAHAWCLAWNQATQTWDDIDTTPASWVAIEGNNASLLDTLSDARSWLYFQFEKLLWREANLRQYILWTFAPVLAVLLYYIFFQRRARARARAKKNRGSPPLWPGLDSAFYRLETALSARGLPRQPQEPLTAWLERVLADPGLAPVREPLRKLLRLHYRYRFDPRGLDENEKASFIQNAATVLETLAEK